MGAMEFYEEMAKAIKDRDHARNMVTKWNTKALEAEYRIEALVAEQERTGEVSQATEV